MEQDDDEPDEDEEFLRAAEKIIDDYRKGMDVSQLVRRLKRPAHSYDEDATGGIYEVLEMIASLDKSTRSPSASPPSASSPMPTNEHSNFNINQLNGSAKKRLCFSPTSQVGECGNNLINETPFVPKLQLDFSLPSSVQHSPQASPVFLASNAVDYSPSLRTRSRQCRSREGSLNASDFVYLIIVGFISSLIVYYIYMPRLHKGPVY